jgi:glycosyltransferase involved in cell wall biosynthesis
MKICYLANSEISHTAKWAKYFAELGHEVHVISHKDSQIQGVKVHYIPYTLKNFPFMVHKVHSLINRINPDVIHAHQANTCGFYATTLQRKKVIVSAWGSDILLVPNLSKLHRWIVKYVIRKAFYMTSDSRYMTEKIIELGGKRDRIFTFPMGIEEHIMKYKRNFKAEDKTLKVISTRRLEKIYNIDIIIKGFYKASLENKNITLTIAADGSEAENLKALVKEYNIEDRVTFSGRYNAETVGELLVQNDVFISIPSSDSTSVSLLESMYCGLFSVVSDLPANREWIKDKENGLITGSINEEDVKKALLWCYDNKEKIIKASDLNTNIIKERALWKENVKIVERMYEEFDGLK